MNSPLHTPLCDKLGIEYPVVAFTHCKDVAVAVINSGGFAVLGEALHTPDEIAADIKWMRERIGGKPFGIDLVLPSSVPEEKKLEDLLAMIPQGHRDFEQMIKQKYNVPDPKIAPDIHHWGGLDQKRAMDQLDVIFDQRVPVFASGLGSPAFLLERAHQLGMQVWGLVGKPKQARRQIAAGTDVIIAQGFDAAGHTGNIGTFSIVPQVVDAAREAGVPVIAAGGITDGRSMAAAFALGAEGVQMGTRMVSAAESPVHQNWKVAIVGAKETDTVFLNRFGPGPALRALRTEKTGTYEREGGEGVMGEFARAKEMYFGGDLEKSIPLTGQVAGRIDAVKPVAQVIAETVAEFEATVKTMGQRWG